MRRLLISTLAALAALGGVAFATRALTDRTNPMTFTFSVTPGRQSVARGGVASFSVNVRRVKGFTGAAALRVTGLPRGMRSGWQRADGTRSRVVPSGETGAILTLRASRRAKLGTRRVRLVARSGGLTLSRRLSVTVLPRKSRRFSLTVSPARQITAPGAGSSRFEVRVARAEGFRGRVALRALRVPRRATGSWSGTTLSIATSARRAVGSFRIVIRGSSRVGGRTIRRYAVVALMVVRSRPFEISGDLARGLYPGGSGPLDLVLTNPHPFDIRVIALGVSARARTSTPGCSGTVNYAVAQYSGGYPLVLRPGSTPMSALRSNPATWPRVAMRNLPFNQDACQRAVVSLDYGGLAIR